MTGVGAGEAPRNFAGEAGLIFKGVEVLQLSWRVRQYFWMGIRFEK